MENLSLSLEQLAAFIRSKDYDYITACERDIDPIHYYVFVKSERVKKVVEEFVCGRRIDGHSVRVVALGQIIVRKWLDELFAQGSGGVMPHEDFMMLALAYTLDHYRAGCWFRTNILMELGISDSEEAMYEALFRYMKFSGHRLKLSSVKCERKKFVLGCRKHNLLRFWDWMNVLRLYVGSKLRFHKAKAAEVSIDEAKEEHCRKAQEFVDFALRELKISMPYEILDPGRNLYGCCFVRAEDILIKGNELTARTNSFRNEVNAQKKLVGLSHNEKELFICMNSYYDDGERKFIVYPYVSGVTLAKNQNLSKERLDVLGEFMVRVLNILDSLGVVHRDFTTWNIMCEGEKFRLFDFGCAYSGEPDILGNDEKFEARIRSGLCGNYKYDRNVWDDAASAYLVYLNCGGKPEDEYAQKIRSLIGRRYTA